MVVGAITVIDGIAGTLIGGWIAQRWLRTNHRALYLLSFWSVALTLPLRRAGLLRSPLPGPFPRSSPPSSSSSSTPARSTPPSSTRSTAPVRATAIACNLFIIHCFGDTFSPQIIGSISDRAQPAPRPRRNADLPGSLLPSSSSPAPASPRLSKKRGTVSGHNPPHRSMLRCNLFRPV